MSDPDAMAVPLAAHPEPVCQYEVRDGVPTVTATNDAFDAAIGVAEREPIEAVFERFDTVGSPGEASPAAQLRAGEAVELALGSDGDDRRYVAHVLAPDADGGTIVFADRDGAEPPADDIEVERVASAIGHDLRNPLDVAGAHLEAARETGESEHFDAVEDAHERMEQIIQDVLTLARGEAALNPEPAVPVRDTAERAWQSVETGAWTLHLDESLPTVTADADRLRRLFENLFRNCVEHAADGGTVRVDTLADGSGVSVADDGPGIPADERAAVFTPGYTVDGDGTGLGLAIVDRIAEAHGWTAAVAESEQGGTRIEIRFDTGA
ncbi:HAMP domain-containing sensor histidine kinase [Halorubrum sp. SD683]|uniref:sensor histidine kinase n=1 Tax=Halorubrum sp. SD683 TaxID=1855873 RepID=UPI000A2E37E2|nr:HAMP domain-containing sensor histidine kinase [Halorubrum sp. SD683]OTF02009.1 two-component sensor histidine kinase [Halorubrum sp. SD683]